MARLKGFSYVPLLAAPAGFWWGLFYGSVFCIYVYVCICMYIYRERYIDFRVYVYVYK